MKTTNSKADTFHLLHPNAAGIDIASNMHYVAVPVGRDEHNIRKFGSFTEDLIEMAKIL